MVVMGRIEAAREALERAAELDPDNSEIDRLLFSVEKLSGDLEEAGERLRAYIESEPQDAQARIDLGNLHLLRGQFDRARRVLEEAELIASDPFEAELSADGSRRALGQVGGCARGNACSHGSDRSARQDR